LAHNPSAHNLLKGSQMKTCTKCNLSQSKTEFCKQTGRADGLQSNCKTCKKKYYKLHKEYLAIKYKKYRDDNSEKLREKNKLYHVNNKASISAKNKIYRSLNTNKALAQQKAWKKANPEKTKTHCKNYRDANSENMSAYRHARRALNKNADGAYVGDDIRALIVKQLNKCVYCRKNLILKGDGKYHIDHRIPLSLGGTNFPDNLQILCPKCNLTKGASHPNDYEIKIGFKIITPQ